jgi:hypothetical protein
MRKNTVKKSIKKVAKKAQRNPEVAVAVTATTAGFAIFGAVEAGLILKNKAKAKIEEIKAKKAEDTAKNKGDNTDNTNNNSNNSNNNDNTTPHQDQQPVVDDAVKNNNEGAEA